MKTKLCLLLLLLLTMIIPFPSICYSELKTVVGEHCDVYLGDLKNMKELDKFRKAVRMVSIEVGVYRRNGGGRDLLEERETENIEKSKKCFNYVIGHYLEKVDIISHTEKGRKICDKVKITLDPEVINKYLSQANCKVSAEDELYYYTTWIHDINNILSKKIDKINIGLIIEIKIPEINEEHRIELLKNEQEIDFNKMIERNKDKYRYIDRRHLSKVLEEQKLSSSGITDSDTLKLGKLLNLEIIVIRFQYDGSLVTKVLKVDTGEVLLFKTYGTVRKEDLWIMRY